MVDSGKHALIDGVGGVLVLHHEFRVKSGSLLCIKDAVLEGLKSSHGVSAESSTLRFEDVTFKNCSRLKNVTPFLKHCNCPSC